jgi:hypothetical protein
MVIREGAVAVMLFETRLAMHLLGGIILLWSNVYGHLEKSDIMEVGGVR